MRLAGAFSTWIGVLLGLGTLAAQQGCAWEARDVGRSCDKGVGRASSL